MSCTKYELMTDSDTPGKKNNGKYEATGTELKGLFNANNLQQLDSENRNMEISELVSMINNEKQTVAN